MRPILGQSVASVAPTYPVPADGSLMPSEIIGTGSEFFSVGQNLHAVANSSGSSTGYFVGNAPAAYPFTLDEAVTVYQMGWQNGSAAGGNWDLGIYDTAWNRLVSTGSTAGSGNNALQFADVADTVLPPGSYYLVVCHDVNTSNHVRQYGQIPGTVGLAMLGVMDSATSAFPLPDPLTNMAAAATVTNVYHLFIALRSVA